MAKKVPTIRPPRDPFLRAIWAVSKAEGLNATERLILLALWRYLGADKKAIGPTLIAGLIGTTPDYAKKLLTSLRNKGYITSDGKSGAGRKNIATRQLTNKISWPRAKKRGVSTTVNDGEKRGAGTLPKRGVSTPTDLGVRHGASSDAHRATTHPDVEEEPTILIADLVSNDTRGRAKP